MKLFKRLALVTLFENAGNHIALALHSTDNDFLPCALLISTTCLFVPMTVLVFAADIGFVNFDNAAEFVFPAQ